MLILDLVYNLSVLVALSVLSGFIDTRYERKGIKGRVFQGFLFGLVAVIGMMYPFEMTEGIIFDGRSIVISLCTLFFGPVSGLISTIISLMFRNYLGGSGAVTGSFVILSSFLIGYYFYNRKQNGKYKLTKTNLYLFGVATSIAMLFFMFTLPSASITHTFRTISATVLIAFPIISLVIGKVLLDQEENRNSIEKIKREESLFKTTLYSIGDAVITTDKNGKIQHMNPIAEKLTGYNEAEGKGKILTDVFKIINEVTRLDVENPVLKVLREKSIVGLANHTLLISKDGNEIPIADSGAPIIDEDGSIMGVVLVFRDQTEDYKNQKKLIENEIRFRSIVEGAPDAIFVQTNHRFAYLNSKASFLFGCKTRDELIGQIVVERFHTSDREKVAERIHELNDNKHEVPMREETIIRLDGSLVTAEFSAMPITYEGKNGALVFFRDVTERKQNEKIIKESEEKLQSIFRAAPIGIGVVVNRVFIEVNPRLCEMTGYQKEELIGKSSRMLYLTQEDYDFVGSEKYRQIASYGTGVVETRFVRKDGKLISVLLASTPIEINDLSKGVTFTALDISDRKKFETDLKNSEEKMRLIIEGTSFFFFYTQDINGDITYISPTVEKITGHKVEEWMNQKHWFTTENPVNDQAVIRTHQHLKGEMILEPLYLEVKHKNGTNILLEIFETPIIKEGKVQGLQGIARDITENKIAEEALRLSEEKFRFLFENHSAVKLLIEADTGNIYDANSAAENFYGWNRNELKQMNISQINILSSDEIQEEMKKAVEEKRVQFQFQHKLADGSIRNVEVFSSKIEIAGIKYLHSIIQDVTEKKKAEEQLKLYREHLEELVKVRTKELNDANKKLLVEIEKEKEYEMLLKQALDKEKEINEIKSRFISTTSHEFRTPLTAVLSSFELIQRYGKNWDQEKYNYHAAKIKNSIEYLTNLLDDVLTISRSESGKIAFEPTHVNLKSMCVELIEESKIHCNEKHKLVYDYEPEQEEFYLDPKLIRFMLTNLLTNAVKYSPAGGIIYLNIKTENDRIIIKVADEGLGIPEDESQYLFEPFHRAKNTAEIQGTGLGLSIVKRSVQLHQGEIKVKSELNKGTAFTIILPLNKGIK